MRLAFVELPLPRPGASVRAVTPAVSLAPNPAEPVEALRGRTRVYIAALALTAAGLGAHLVSQTGPIGRDKAALAVAMTALMVVAWLFPLPFSYQTKLYLDTSVIFATVLLFDPGIAIGLVASGTAIAHFIRRLTAGELLLNSSQTALQAAIGGLILHLGGWSALAPRFDRGRELLTVCFAGLAMYLVNTCSIAGVIALQTSIAPLRVWFEATLDTNRTEILAHLAQLAIGLIAAIVANQQPWSVALLVLPTAAVYISFARRITMRRKPGGRACHQPS